MEQNNQLEQEQEKRKERRRRRIRNQIGAYMALFFVIVVIIAGIVIGIRYLAERNRSIPVDVGKEEELVNNILGEEESLVPPVQESETTEEPEPIIEKTPEEKLDEIVDAGIEVMPIEDKVAGLFIVTPESITGVSTAIKAGERTQNALAQYAVGGIVYSSKNLQSEKQITEMISITAQYSKYPLFFAVEEEGGTVSSVAESGIVERVDAAKTIGETQDANNAYIAGTTIGAYLLKLGFNLNFAPVADIANVENSIMEGRVYGKNAEEAAAFVTAMIQGLKEQKIAACIKHFPGIGSSTQDTHNGLASTDRSAEQFRAEEFTIFQAGIDAGADMIMVSHMAAPSLAGDNTPCSMSKEVITDILRTEMNFNGVIISDAMNMAAVSNYYEADVAAITALKAGCDMILMPDNFEKAYQGVLQAVQDGTISEERINDSLRRIYRIKYADKLEQ